MGRKQWLWVVLAAGTALTAAGCGKAAAPAGPAPGPAAGPEAPAPGGEAFQAAVTFATANPEAGDIAAERFAAVERDFAGTPWAVQARQRREEFVARLAQSALAAAAAREAEGGHPALAAALAAYGAVVLQFPNTVQAAEAMECRENLLRKTTRIELTAEPGITLLEVRLKARVTSPFEGAATELLWTIGGPEEAGDPEKTVRFNAPGVHPVTVRCEIGGIIAAEAGLNLDLGLEACRARLAGLLREAADDTLRGRYDAALEHCGGFVGVDAFETVFAAATGGINQLATGFPGLTRRLQELYRNRDFDGMVACLNSEPGRDLPLEAGGIVGTVIRTELVKVAALQRLWRDLEGLVRANAGNSVRLGGMKGKIVTVAGGAIEMDLAGQVFTLPVARLRTAEIEELGTTARMPVPVAALAGLYEAEGDFAAARSRLQGAVARGETGLEQLLASVDGREAAALGVPAVTTGGGRPASAPAADAVETGGPSARERSLTRQVAGMRKTLGDLESNQKRLADRLLNLDAQIKQLAAQRDSYERAYRIGIEEQYDDWKQAQESVKKLEAERDSCKIQLDSVNRKIDSENKRLRSRELELNRLSQ
ncbi:MAG: hypothetical protein ABIF71_02575 [Planctomycetota bacterium]